MWAQKDNGGKQSSNIGNFFTLLNLGGISFQRKEEFCFHSNSVLGPPYSPNLAELYVRVYSAYYCALEAMMKPLTSLHLGCQVEFEPGLTIFRASPSMTLKTNIMP